MLLTYGIPLEFRDDGVHLFIKTAIRHRVSPPEFIGSHAINCVPMAFTAKSPPGQAQQTSSR